MAVQFASNLSLKAKLPNFERDQFQNLAAAKAYDTNFLDEGHLAYCIDEGKTYRWTAAGGWQEFGTGGGGASVEVDTALDASSGNAVANSAVTAAVNGLSENITTNSQNIANATGTKTLGERTVTYYAGGAVVDLGQMDSRNAVSSWLVKGGVWNNVDLRLVLCTIGTSKVAVQVINSYDTAQGKCTQVMMEGQSTFVRRLISGSIPAWELTALHNISPSWNSSTRTASFALQDYHGATCRTSTLTIPEATASAAGLMPASAVSKLADLETRIAALEGA